MQLNDWIEANGIDASISPPLLKADNKVYLIINHKQDKLFDDKFNLIVSPQELEYISQAHYFLFCFGGKWYCSPTDSEKVQLNLFKYIGKKVNTLDNFPQLGIHGQYDLCNGSRLYGDWIKKAKFLQIDTLGICEANTLAGTLPFQQACKKEGIKSVLGETITVSNKRDDIYSVKLYVKNKKGWNNLLHINAQINVFNEHQLIDEETLFELSEGLVCVLESGFKLSNGSINRFKKYFDDIYYQFDPVEWANDERDKLHLNNLKLYLNNFYNLIPPCFICDAYYLDKEDAHIKHTLNKIGKIRFQNQSFDQYFKSYDDIYLSLNYLFKDDRIFDLCEKAESNVKKIADSCDFEIELGKFHLPEYEMTEIEERQFETNEDLFFHLIELGLESKVPQRYLDKYFNRIEEEVRIIKKGGFVDYFLITWDIINWCKSKDILTGVGRGSSGGSLIAFLLGITKIDPIPYNLLFERFLNEGRIGKSLPDFDSDMEGSRRGEVKRYIEQRYGVDNVTSIGTYSTLKMRAAIKDLARIKGLDATIVNYHTAIIPPESSMGDLFKEATESVSLKKFVQNNFDLINDIPLLFGQQKNSSVHAAGVIISPKEYNGKKMTIYDWMPVKKIDGVLVSEWEGIYIDMAGFLKQDILGIRQLEKFKSIINLIKKNRGEEVNIENISLDEQGVYNLFQHGFNEDVFQFGASGLKGYCQDLKPNDLEDLIATVALYRPGPIEINAHNDYVKIKNGKKIPEFDEGTEEITKDTGGIYCYQEQIMQICQKLGGFTLTQADDIRAGMGKKDVDKMMKYKSLFVDGAMKSGHDETKALALWDKMEGFAGYCFNKSHAVAYAITGYISQWFKYRYPLEFWVTSLQYADDDDLPKRISEIHKTSNIAINSVDINESHTEFTYKDNNIYWSIESVKWVGDKAVQSLIEERETAGNFYSLEELYDRVEKRTVNKRCIVNLILAGAFDKIENIKDVRDRETIIAKFIDLIGEKIPEELTNCKDWEEYIWIQKQKELSGLGHIDFEKLFNEHGFENYQFIDPQYFYTDTYLGGGKCAIGVINKVIERKSKNGKFAQISLYCNHEEVFCTMWSSIWEKQKENIVGNEGKIVLITGTVKFDNYKKSNVLYSDNKTKIKII